MTLLWCAYCQEFQGEKSPFERLDVSHGLCPICKKRGLALSQEEFDHANRLRAIQSQLWIAGREENLQAAVQLVARAKNEGIRPVDILVGILAPLLYQVGCMWEAGTMTVSEEHRFTAFAEKILHHIEITFDTEPSLPVRKEQERVLILSANGNEHSLGPRMLALWCRSKGISARAVYPGLPTAEITALIQKQKPECLGISVSLAGQIQAAQEMVKTIQNIAAPLRPRIVVGGYAVKMGLLPQIPGATLIQDPQELFKQLLAS